MRDNLLVSILLFSSIILRCSVAFGQPDRACGQPWQASLDYIDGHITAVYYAVPSGTGRQGLHLDVATVAGPITVHVFPKRCIETNPDKFRFQVGDRVKVTGSPFWTQGGSKQNICAQSIRSHYLDNLRDRYTGSLNETYCRNCQTQCADRPNWECCMEQCRNGRPVDDCGPSSDFCNARCERTGNYSRCMQNCMEGGSGGNSTGYRRRGPGGRSVR